MYDHNGLQLTPAADTMNAYRRTAVNLGEKKFSAYAASRPRFKGDFSMHSIGMYKDPRDAAFVAQEFEKLYDKEKVRQMVTDGTLTEIARDFRETIEIPEWQYEPEGFTIEELLNGGYEEYKRNYVDNAKEALVEALRVAEKKTPDLKTAKKMIEEVENLKASGMTYRNAAKTVVEKI